MDPVETTAVIRPSITDCHMGEMPYRLNGVYIKIFKLQHQPKEQKSDESVYKTVNSVTYRVGIRRVALIA